MTRRLFTGALAFLVVVAGCSLPTDESAQPINPEQLPDELRTDITTTTATTVPETPRTVSIQLFLLFASETDRAVVSFVEREIDTTATLLERLSLLFGDLRTEEEVELGLFNPLSEFTLLSASVNDNDVANIDVVVTDIDGEVIIPENEVLRNAAAQLVYTTMGFDNIVAVRIRYNGERTVIPTSTGDTEDVLTTHDYNTYDPEFVEPTETVPASTTTEPEDTTTTADG